MRSISTSIVIAAPADKIWNILTDLPAYPDWNPFFKEATGELAVGKTLHISAREQNFKFSPKLLVVNPGQELRWKGKLGVKGIFDGEHYFIITDKGDGTCTFDHGERFHGCLVPVMGALSSLFKDTEKGFVKLNKALKERCEAQA